MSIKTIFPVILVALGINNLVAQNYCGTTELNESWINYYHNHKDQFAQDEGKVLYIPMLVNVLRNDDGEGEIPFLKLYQTIGKLNSDFEQVDVQFYLPEDFIKVDRTDWYDHKDYSGGTQMMRALNKQSGINCYIVKNPAGNCGYYSPRNDGLAVGSGCMGRGSSTWTHEMGHLLTLPHTFYGCEGVDYRSDTKVEEFKNEIRGVLEKVDGSNCHVAADRFCDTKPDYLSYRWNCNGDGESNLEQIDLNGDTFKSNGQLFMSYSNDACTSIFTPEQINAMRANLSGARSSIIHDKTPQISKLEDTELIMISPLENETIHYQNVNIEWEPIVGATHYYIEVSRRSSFSGNSTFREVVRSANLHIDELIDDQNYYIRILPFNLSAFNENFSRTIAIKTSNLTANKNISTLEDEIKISSLINTGENLSVINNNSSLLSSLTYSIHSLVGERFIHSKQIDFERKFQIATDHLKPGIYIIEFESKGATRFTKRFVIQ